MPTKRINDDDDDDDDDDIAYFFRVTDAPTAEHCTNSAMTVPLTHSRPVYDFHSARTLIPFPPIYLPFSPVPSISSPPVIVAVRGKTPKNANCTVRMSICVLI